MRDKQSLLGRWMVPTLVQQANRSVDYYKGSTIHNLHNTMLVRRNIYNYIITMVMTLYSTTATTVAVTTVIGEMP